jgi:hypothetical protein
MPPFLYSSLRYMEIFVQWYDTWTVVEVAQRGTEGHLVVLS